MQPTYFPWAGYFSLIGQVDIFVFLDDVQYERSNWHNRNRILLNGQIHWLTVPVVRQFLGQPINQVTVDDTRNWRQKHLRLLSQAYAKRSHAPEMLNSADVILDSSLGNLADLNIRVIAELARNLELSTKMLRSSELGIAGNRTERLIGICEQLQCDEYVSPVGATQYLSDDGFKKKTSIRLSFNEFVPAEYPQPKADTFVSHLSVLDVIANLGWDGTKDYVRDVPTKVRHD